MLEADPKYYEELQNRLVREGRWFTAGLIACGISVAFALEGGPSGGWPWLLGALVSLGLALCARIDQQHTSVLIQIYLASPKK